MKMRRMSPRSITISPSAQRAEASQELSRLSTRARLVNFAISLCTICALLTCIMIATLFTGTFLVVNLSKLIAVMFIAAMLSLFLALMSFLREIITATRNLRISSGAQAPGKASAKRDPPLVQE